MKSKIKDIDETKIEIEYHFFPIEPYPDRTCYHYLTPMEINGNYWDHKRQVFYQHYMNSRGFLIHKKYLENLLDLSNKLTFYMDNK